MGGPRRATYPSSLVQLRTNVTRRLMYRFSASHNRIRDAGRTMDVVPFLSKVHPRVHSIFLSRIFPGKNGRIDCDRLIVL